MVRFRRKIGYKAEVSSVPPLSEKTQSTQLGFLCKECIIQERVSFI